MSGTQTTVLAPARQSGATPVRTATRPLLAQRCACGGSAGLDGECESCREERLGLKRFIQPKLAVHPIGDPYEVEADRVAEQITAGSANAVDADVPSLAPPPPSITPVVQRAEETTSSEEDEKRDDDEVRDGEVQRVSAAGADGDDEEDEDAVQRQGARVVRSPAEGRLRRVERLLAARAGQGRPLPAETRRFMEPRFGVDFSRVRVHTDAEASGMADDLSSLAFAYGHDIYFRAGAYSPGTPAGTRLLAHELTHVVQQGGGARGDVQRASAWLEKAPRYRGTIVHKAIEERFRNHPQNTGLVTEAPIPGGGIKGRFPHDPEWFARVGQADFYRSGRSPKITGIRGAFAAGSEGDMSAASFTALSKPSSTKSKASVGRGPVMTDEKAQKASGRFPASVELADLKPLADPKVGEGINQIGNYKEGFQAFAAEAGKRLGSVGSVTVVEMKKLAVPDELDYTQIDKQQKSGTPKNAVLSKEITGDTRMWVARIPNLGLVVYFPLPHPNPGLARGEVDKVFRALQPISKTLRASKPKITTAPPVVGSKRIAHAATPPRPTARVQRAPPTGKKSKDDFDGKAWETRRENWVEAHARPLLEGSADRSKRKPTKGALEVKGIANVERGSLAHAIDERRKADKDLTKLGAALPAKAVDVATLDKSIDRIAFWAGVKGKGLGILRDKLGATFTRIADFFEDKKKRFEAAHAKIRTPKKPFAVGWMAKLFKHLLPVMKKAFGLFLVASFEVFKACFNTLIHKLIDRFVDDMSEELEAQLKKLDEEFHRFEAEFRTLFEERLAKLDEFADVVADVQEWEDYFRTLEFVIRGAVQLVSCGTPPAIGCLWGLVVQVGLDIAIDLLVGTEIFQQQVLNPAVKDLVDRYASPWYRQLIAEVIEKSGSTELKKLAQATPACRPQTTERLTAGLPSGSGLSGAALDEHRRKWEKANGGRLFEEVRKELGISEDELRKLLEEMKDTKPTREELAKKLEARRKGGGTPGGAGEGDGEAAPEKGGKPGAPPPLRPENIAERMRNSGMTRRELKKLASGQSAEDIFGPKPIEWPEPGAEDAGGEGKGAPAAPEPAAGGKPGNLFEALGGGARPSHEKVDALGAEMKRLKDAGELTSDDLAELAEKMEYDKPGGGEAAQKVLKRARRPAPPPPRPSAGISGKGGLGPRKRPPIGIGKYPGQADKPSEGPPPVIEIGPKVFGDEPGDPEKKRVTPGISIPIPGT